MRKKPFKEGDWFGVPINSHFVAGRVAGVGRQGGILIGYFFEPLLAAVPALESLNNLRPEDAFLIARFTDPGLAKEGWPIIPGETDWQSELWPIPAFGRLSIYVPGTGFATPYNVDNVSIRGRETMVSAAEAMTLPMDGLHGHIALQYSLSKYFREGCKKVYLREPPLSTSWYQGLPAKRS
jgi:hypothetical protein